MPFTLAHPAAIAPFWRTRVRRDLPLGALVIGTMVPDFEYLFRLRPMSVWSHTLAGLVTFCVPVGLVAVVFWYALIRTPMRELLALRPQGAEPAPWTANWWLRAAIAVLFGAATHLLWDGCTHKAGWAMGLVPQLQHTAIVLRGYPMPWFRLLQHGSTLIGGIVVLRWLWPQMSATNALHRIASTRWRIASLAGIAGASVLAALWNATRTLALPGGAGTVNLAGRLAVGGLAGLMLGLIAYGAWYRLASPAPDALFPTPRA